MRNLLLGKEIIRFSMPFLLAVAIAALAGCGGAGSGAAGAATTPASGVAATTVTAASLALSAFPQTAKSDGGVTSTTINVTALNAANAAVPNVTVTMSTDTGILGAGAVVTGSAGTATVTFSAGASRFNRLAIITATAGAVSAQIPVQIVGSTVTVNSTGATLPDNGTSPVTLTITAKDAGNNIVTSAAVALTKIAGGGTVTFTPASGATDPITGTFTSVVTGTVAGAVTVSAAALGATATTALTVSPSAATFGIDQLTLNAGAPVAGNPGTTAMKIGDSLVVRVNAPGLTSVNFATTTGSFTGVGAVPASGPVVTVPVAAGKATATLTTTQAGIATIQVYDPTAPATSASLTVGMTSATAASITLQPSPGVVSKSGGTAGTTSTLTAMVLDSSGFPVGGAPVAFSIINPTGGGETVSPVVVFSAATTAGGLNLGEARATFTSGSLPSGAGGIQVRASVVGSAVTTNTAPSGPDATIVIGGTAGSVAFGRATVISTDPNNLGNYILPMSILVLDSNGNAAPLGTVVNLSAWPVAWSTGTACTPDPDTATTGTFKNEDANENLIFDSYTLSNATVAGGTTVTVSSTAHLVKGMPISGGGFPAGTIIASITNSTTFVTSAAGTNAGGVTLQAGEDGTRAYYNAVSGVAAGGTMDGQLTPPNAAGGGLPATVTLNAVDANGNPTGAASFNLTYTKGNAIWIITRIRARTVLQSGSAAVGEIAFRLVPSVTDVTPTTCLLPPSPYSF